MSPPAPLPRAGVLAGLRYFAVIFAAGFALGTLRVLLVAPRLGDMAAVAFELPLMLALSFWVAGWLITRHAVPMGLARVWMGLTGFVVLILAEALLAVWGFGQSLSQWAAAMATPPGLLGLAGQIGFGLMPVLRGAPLPRSTGMRQR